LGIGRGRRGRNGRKKKTHLFQQVIQPHELLVRQPPRTTVRDMLDDLDSLTQESGAFGSEDGGFFGMDGREGGARGAFIVSLARHCRQMMSWGREEEEVKKEKAEVDEKEVGRKERTPWTFDVLTSTGEARE
jgi:hypothetical protein